MTDVQVLVSSMLTIAAFAFLQVVTVLMLALFM